MNKPTWQRLAAAVVSGAVVGHVLTILGVVCVMLIGGYPPATVLRWLPIAPLAVSRTAALPLLLAALAGFSIGEWSPTTRTPIRVAASALIPPLWLIVLALLFPESRSVQEAVLYLSAPLFVPPLLIGAVMGWSSALFARPVGFRN